MINDISLSFKNHWKVFLISLIAQFVIISLLNFGVRSPQIFDFLLFSKISKSVQSQVGVHEGSAVLDEIKIKLEGKKSYFQLQSSGVQNHPAASGYYQNVSSYIIVDESGHILGEKNPNQKVSIASLTKIMSAVVALDLVSPTEIFSVTNRATHVEPTTIGLSAGEKISLSDLLHGMLLTSGNDATQVVKDGIDQKYEQGTFVRAMNEKAKILGLKNTHFANPQGYDDPENYSSALDLSILTYYALENYPEIAAIVKKDYQYIPTGNLQKWFDLYNWNGLLGVYPGVEGVKIGNTKEARHTTVVVANRSDHKVMAVLLGAPGVLQRDLWASKLLDVGFEKLGISSANITSEQLQAKYATWKYFG